MTTKQIIGTICACMGIVFASGDTIVNGLLAIACFSIAAITLRPAVAKRSEKRIVLRSLKERLGSKESKKSEKSAGGYQTAA